MKNPTGSEYDMSISRHQAVGAYQRWSPPAFDDPAQPERSGEETVPPDATDGSDAFAQENAETEAPSPMPAIKLPTAEEIEVMFEQARQQGYESGHAEGLQSGYEEGSRKGHEEGYAAGQQQGLSEGRETGQSAAQEEAREQNAVIAARLTALVDAMDQALDAMGQEVAEEIVALAIELARQMIGRAFDGHPETAAAAVRQALALLPQGKVNIHLHPEDVALVREYLADQLEHGHHRLIDDETLTRGGCRIETANSEVDATVETRWRRILEGLGRSGNEWQT